MGVTDLIRVFFTQFFDVNASGAPGDVHRQAPGFVDGNREVQLLPDVQLLFNQHLFNGVVRHRHLQKLGSLAGNLFRGASETDCSRFASFPHGYQHFQDNRQTDFLAASTASRAIEAALPLRNGQSKLFQQRLAVMLQYPGHSTFAISMPGTFCFSICLYLNTLASNEPC